MKTIIHVLMTAAALLAALTPAFATEFDPSLMHKDHPRMFFTSDTWPRINAAAHGYGREELDKLLAEVDALPDNPVCPELKALDNAKTALQSDGTVIKLTVTGITYPTQWGKESAMSALAWRFTGDPKYLEKTKKLLKASIDVYTRATELRRPVDWYCFTRINALLAYDWIYEALSPEERRDIIVPLIEHVKLVQPSYGLNIPRQQSGSPKDGFYCMNTLLWYAGLATYGDGFCDDEALRQLKEGYRLSVATCEYRNDMAGDDGGLSSAAVNYAMHVYPYAHFNFFYTYLSAFGENLAPKYPNIALLPQWLWWVWIRDEEQPKACRTTGTGDVEHDSNTYYAILFYEHMRNYTNFYSSVNPEAAQMAAAMRDLAPRKTLGRDFPIYRFLVNEFCPVDDETLEKIESSPMKCRHFESLGQFYMRSAWTPDATYCTFTAGGTVTQHKHYDENNFAIYKHDHLALDTGCRGKEGSLNLAYYYSQSVAHNVVLIHKPGEPKPIYWGPSTDDPGANLNYGGMVNFTPATILGYETGDAYTYVASDATACYGDKCTEAVRQFVYLYPDCFIVYDRVGAADSTFRKDWLLHTQNKPIVKGNLIRTDSGDGRLFCETFLPADAQFNLVGGPGKEFWVNGRNFPIEPEIYEKAFDNAARWWHRGPYYGAWRVEETPAGHNLDDRFLNVLTATSVNYPKPVKATYTAEKDCDAVTVTVKSGKYTFRFNRTGAVGGTVTVKGRTTPLADTVQPQSGILYE